MKIMRKTRRSRPRIVYWIAVKPAWEAGAVSRRMTQRARGPCGVLCACHIASPCPRAGFVTGDCRKYNKEEIV